MAGFRFPGSMGPDDEEELGALPFANPEEVVEQPLPLGVQDSPEQAAAPQSPPGLTNPRVIDHMRKILGEKYSDEARSKIESQNAEDASGPNWGAALAALGGGLQGGNAAEIGQNFLKRQQGEREAKLTNFDKSRAGIVDNYKNNIAFRDDAQNQELKAQERDPNSDASKLAQQAAKELGVNPDLISKITAEQFKAQGPLYEKIYKAKQDRLARSDLARTRLEAKNSGATEGQKATDKGYAKDYNDFTGGGETKAINALSKLKSLREEMAKDNGLIQAGGGQIVGSLPDAFRTEQSIARRDNIITTANSALKATFGGQLSDGEREALAKEFYNDKLSNAENLKVIDRKIAELGSGLMTARAKAKYFADRGSLTGFRGPERPDEETSVAGADKKNDEKAPWPRTVKKGGKRATVSNESELKDAIKEGWT